MEDKIIAEQIQFVPPYQLKVVEARNDVTELTITTEILE